MENLEKRHQQQILGQKIVEIYEQYPNPARKEFLETVFVELENSLYLQIVCDTFCITKSLPDRQLVPIENRDRIAIGKRISKIGISDLGSASIAVENEILISVELSMHRPEIYTVISKATQSEIDEVEDVFA